MKKKRRFKWANQKLCSKINWKKFYLERGKYIIYFGYSNKDGSEQYRFKFYKDRKIQFKAFA